MNAGTLDLMLRTELPAARRGSNEAYGRIVRACQNTVTAIALAITGDVQASEDIAQEAFLSAWQQLDRLRNSASFLPWMRQITRNLARDWLRAQAQRPLSRGGCSCHRTHSLCCSESAKRPGGPPPGQSALA